MIKQILAFIIAPFVPDGYEVGLMGAFLPNTITFGFTFHWGNCTCQFCGGINGFIINLFSWSFTFYWRKTWDQN